MVKGLWISSGANSPIEEREFSGLADYQTAVGGWIEAADIPALGITLYVNEEGLLRHLPLNSRATFLWWYHVPTVRQSAMLVGDAVIVGLPNPEGDSTDVPDEAITLLTQPSSYKLEVLTIKPPTWYTVPDVYSDYFEAIVWAMLLIERGVYATDARVVPVYAD